MENIMVIGSGGREHALAWKLAQSEHVGKIYAVPGSDAISREPKCKSVPGELKWENFSKLADFSKENKVKLAVVGPEQPLMEGFADLFEAHGVSVLGPRRRGAELEGSKAYAKDFMERYGVPTARFKTFSDYAAARNYLESVSHPVYVKASGLAGGKGALPGRTREDALNALRRIMLDKEFKDAGKEVVVEELLDGEETSCMALVNSEEGIVSPLPFSQDHKKLLDGDEGPNTGGMGAYSPTRLVNNFMSDEIAMAVLGRTLHGMKSENMDYVGALYPGLMITADGPRVLEYNVRMGDPETQAILPLLKSDLFVGIKDVVEGKRPVIAKLPGYQVCVVLASRGYPGTPEKGKKIEGLDAVQDMRDVKVFHAGTKLQDGVFYTNGGRVLGLTAYGETIGEARELAYKAVDRIHFDGMQFRKDIGLREANRK